MIPRIDPAEAHKRLTDQPETVYLDVRSTPEFAAGHPPGAYNIPLLEPGPSGMMQPNPNFVAEVEAVFGKEQSMVVGCRSGNRSWQAANLLAQAGYTDVTDMAGGFHGQVNEIGMKLQAGWAELGLPQEQGMGGERSWESLKGR